MFRKRLIDFYERHNPACLDSVDDILDIFSGREEELFCVLREKYADAPLVERNECTTVLSRQSAIAAYNQELESATPFSRPMAERSSRSVCCGETSSSLPRRGLKELQRFYKKDEDSDKAERRVEVGRASFVSQPYSIRDNERNKLGVVEANKKLLAENHSLRCEVVILQAEKEALTRQKKDDEETLEKLRAHITYHDDIERQLIESVSANALVGKSVLNEEEFASIIGASQERLKGYYEEKIDFMRMEMDTFYKHAADRIKEKDAIIVALKDFLGQR
jgi:hypothetical protein